MRTTFILLTWTLGLQTLSALDWPQWRGPNRDGVSKETGLLKSCPAAGPPRAWIFSNAGTGYSSFSIANGKLYTMGSRRGTEQLICLDARTGREQWAANIGPELKNNWGGGPRGTPSVDGSRIYAMGGQGNLICTDLNGRIHWQTSMNRLGGKTPGWGYTESVLVDGNLVIATPAVIRAPWLHSTNKPAKSPGAVNSLRMAPNIPRSSPSITTASANTFS